MKTARKLLLLISCCALGAGAASVVHAEGDGPLRTLLKQRIVKKLNEEPSVALTPTSQRITAPDDYVFSIKYGGVDRRYKLHVPPSYNGAPTPLIVSMHGGGGDMDYMSRDEFYGFISKSNQAGYLVVFPNGYSRFGSGKLATWNGGGCCGDARDNNVDDVGFIRQMLANLNAQLNIDRNRIYATGMSNGGIMSHRLACEMADTFKAIAPVAGTDNTFKCNPARPVSVIMFHAKNDDHVLFNGGAGEGAFRDESKVTNFTSVPETVARWVQRNSCQPTPRRVVNVPGAYCDLYASCAEGTKVEVCVTETGGHSWPGGSKPGGIKSKEPTSKAINADDEMWKFFQSLN